MNYISFLLLHIFIWAGIATDDDYTPPYDEVFADGLNAYSNDNHTEAVKYFEQAIADFHFEKDVKAQCWIKCQENSDKILSSDYNILDGQLRFLHYSIKISSCVSSCQKRFLGPRGPVLPSVTKQFTDHNVYSYLQLSYFKIGQVEKAANAAYTYLQLHSSDATMQNKLNILLQKLSKNETFPQSLEEYEHITLYKLGEKAYDKQNYAECTRLFEESLSLFYKEEQKCNALCEMQRENKQGSYTKVMYDHFHKIVECRQICRRDLTRIDGRTSTQNFVPYYFHYLQFCYYQVGNVLEAANAAETYLMLIPTDVTMMKNLGLYRKNQEVKRKTVKPREQASKYFKQFAIELTLSRYTKAYLNDQSGDNTLEMEEQTLEAIYKTVDKDLKSKKPMKGDLDTPKLALQLRSKQYRDQGRWKRHGTINQAVLLMEEDKLNGTDRVAFDNVANEDECRQLMKLVQLLPLPSRHIMVKRSLTLLLRCFDTFDHDAPASLAKSGDGYEHNHDNAAHPFTEKEIFKGITVRDAVDAVESGKASASHVDAYITLSEKVRLLTQEYFDLPKRLNFAFTHLVCRHALNEKINPDEEHVSHPIHSDNCVLDGDGVGTCPKRSPAYTWRDYSALLYLNDEFSGGDFVFANYKREIQTRVRPKCGRLVSFRSNGLKNLHGVLGVTNGTRCALPIWFTFSNTSEDGRGDAEKKFKSLMSGKKDEL